MNRIPTQSSDTRKKAINKPKYVSEKPNTKPKYKPKTKPKPKNKILPPKKCPCSVFQILAIVIPISFIQLVLVIFLPVYLTKKKQKEEITQITDNNNISYSNSINYTYQEFDDFDYITYNSTFATLTPKNGYSHIYIHLGGIGEMAGYYESFFRSNRTFVPKRTKIYYLAGKSRVNKFFEEKSSTGSTIDGIIHIHSWFNVDSEGKLICDNCNGDDFAEAKESLYLILDIIDQISIEENIDYNKIYLGGFGQGAIMTNYVMLNSRNKLGGYLAFSGYIIDHHFPSNTVVKELSDEQKQILESKKDYHILASHSFNDGSVYYSRIIEGYYTYYKDYTDLTLLNFGELGHNFEDQPTHPFVRKWLQESMGK